VAQTQDDAFHEIQLNGKQLVFLVMAATVVSVVIFLCGVLFGRGVRAERSLAEGTSATVAEVTPQQPPALTPPPASSDPTKAAAPTGSDEKLTYWDRLDKPAKGSGKPAAAAPVPAPAKSAPVEAPAASESTTPSVTSATSAPNTTSAASAPQGQGFAVQIAALNLRSEADAIAKRLTSKGYSAYVLAPPSGTPSVFRVRVGKFNTRREAETVAAKLQKEEQFKPWVTR
jgi:cell division septation protein DedD